MANTIFSRIWAWILSIFAVFGAGTGKAPAQQPPVMETAPAILEAKAEEENPEILEIGDTLTVVSEENISVTLIKTNGNKLTVQVTCDPNCTYGLYDGTEVFVVTNQSVVTINNAELEAFVM